MLTIDKTANKDLLVSFLNAIIDAPQDPVVDLHYKNVEQIGEFNGTRANYFDVYCETKGGRQFIVEMQNSWKPFFKDRTLFYAVKPIRDQGLKELEGAELNGKAEPLKKGKKPQWNYRLNEVCLIAIMNFTFPKREYREDSYFHKVMLSDIDDNHVFYDKLTPAQQLEYERSKKVYLDTYNEIEGGRILGREEGYKWGFEDGREKGMAEGEAKAFSDLAIKLRAEGFDEDTICKLTGS